METTINGRTYEVKPVAVGWRTREDLESRGWDGGLYALRGKRGANYLGYRRADRNGGDYVIVTRLGRDCGTR